MNASASLDRPITVLVVDDHTLLRKGLVGLLQDRGVTVLGEASDGRGAIEQAARLNPDVILMDANMSACSGIEPVRAIRERMPDARVLMISVSDNDENLFAAVKAGAKGYVLKSVEPDELVSAIERVMEGEAVIPHEMVSKFLQEFALLANGRVPPTSGASRALTAREEEILCQLADGSANRAIANTLSISEHTVKIHLKNILKKLNMNNRTQAAIYAQRHGLVATAKACP